MSFSDFGPPTPESVCNPLTLIEEPLPFPSNVSRTHLDTNHSRAEHVSERLDN